MSAMLAGAEKRASDALGRTQQLLQREASLVEVRTRLSRSLQLPVRSGNGV